MLLAEKVVLHVRVVVLLARVVLRTRIVLLTRVMLHARVVGLFRGRHFPQEPGMRPPRVVVHHEMHKPRVESHEQRQRYSGGTLSVYDAIGALIASN